MSTSPSAYHTAALESMPPELQGLSEGEDSSLDDSMNSKSSTCSSDSDNSSCVVAVGGSLVNQHHQHRPRPPRTPPSFSSNAKKRVSWDRIHTREYALVVGDHPLCQDGLPVSLGWQYIDHATPSVPLRLQQQQSQQQQPQLPPPQPQPQQQQQPQVAGRHAAYVFPRRLSYEERRDRLQEVSNLTLDEIKSDEIDLVVRTLQESWGDTNDVLDGLGLVEDWMEPDPLPPTSTTATTARAAVDRDGDAVMMDVPAAVANINDDNKNETSGISMDQLLFFGDDSDDDLSNFDWGD